MSNTLLEELKQLWPQGHKPRHLYRCPGDSQVGPPTNLSYLMERVIAALSAPSHARQSHNCATRCFAVSEEERCVNCPSRLPQAQGETPRTDALVGKDNSILGGDLSGLCRQLERELAEANKRAHYEATWHNHYAQSSTRRTHDESAWLIEMPAARWGTGFYWTGVHEYNEWGTLDKAIRFVRKQDAEAVIASMKERRPYAKMELEACEHVWSDGARQLPPDVLDALCKDEQMPGCKAYLDRGLRCSTCPAIAASAIEPTETELMLNRVMGLLRDRKMNHGLCKPRERRACTACNAMDDLEGLAAAWTGPRVIATTDGRAKP